jgi:hypothetical protein
VKVDKLVAVVVKCKVVVESADTVIVAPKFGSAAFGVTVWVMVERPAAVTVDKLRDVVVTCEVMVENSVIVALAPAPAPTPTPTPTPTCNPAVVIVCVVVEIDEMVCVSVETMETV